MEFDHESLVITISDHSAIGFNAQIGSLSIDLFSIYSEKKHRTINKWIALSNSKKNFD